MKKSTESLSSFSLDFQKIITIRAFEEELSSIYSQGKVRCPVHLAIGHEAAAVGVCSVLNPEDSIFSYHRSHHHFLAKGGAAKSLLAELCGSDQGCAFGYGGSTHLYGPEFGFEGSTAIISGTLPLATGLAHSIKLKKENRIVVSFSGDASLEEGVFFESLNMASLWKLPILFVIEDNDLSCYTEKSKRHGIAGFSQIAELFKMPFKDCDGKDYFSVRSAAKDLTTAIREKSGPALLRVQVYRAHEHCGPDNDDQLFYRDVQGSWPERDPLHFLKSRPQILDFTEMESLEKKIRMEMKELFFSLQESR